MAIYVYGCDLREFDAAQIIAQIYYADCNCVTTVGKGLSDSIAEKYPYADFYTNNPQRKVGTIEIRGGGTAAERWICAMYAQHHPGKASARDDDTVKNRVVWFKECLRRIATIKNLRSIAFPRKIGCGLAGGDWTVYRKIIEEWAVSFAGAVKVYLVSPENFEDLIIASQKDTTKTVVTTVTASHPQTTSSKSSATYANTSVIELATSQLAKNWPELLKRLINGDCLQDISTFIFKEAAVAAKKIIYPPPNLLFNVFNIVTPSSVRVVCIAQDPYVREGQATGIAFSVGEGTEVPPSLKNIYQELKNDGFSVKDETKGDLMKWCRQGVFLINTALTVRAGESSSHSKIWNECFTPELMRYLNRECKPLVVIMWGAHAQSFSSYFDDNRHKKITSAHPSPLSAHKGFFGSSPFTKANKMLLELKQEKIDWSL